MEMVFFVEMEPCDVGECSCGHGAGFDHAHGAKFGVHEGACLHDDDDRRCHSHVHKCDCGKGNSLYAHDKDAKSCEAVHEYKGCNGGECNLHEDADNLISTLVMLLMDLWRRMMTTWRTVRRRQRWHGQICSKWRQQNERVCGRVR